MQECGEKRLEVFRFCYLPSYAGSSKLFPVETDELRSRVLRTVSIVRYVIVESGVRIEYPRSPHPSEKRGIVI